MTQIGEQLLNEWQSLNKVPLVLSEFAFINNKSKSHLR